MTTEHVVRTSVSANTRRMKKIVLPQGGGVDKQKITSNVYTHDVDKTHEVGGCCEDQMVARQIKTVNINGF